MKKDHVLWLQSVCPYLQVTSFMQVIHYSGKWTSWQVHPIGPSHLLVMLNTTDFTMDTQDLGFIGEKL